MVNRTRPSGNPKMYEMYMHLVWNYQDGEREKVRGMNKSSSIRVLDIKTTAHR